MKVLIIGATGVIGSAIAKGLADNHEVIRVGHSSGDLRVDITDTNSMTQLFKTVGRVDAVVSAAGEMYTGPLETMTREQISQLRHGSSDLLQITTQKLNLGYRRPQKPILSGHFCDVCGKTEVSVQQINGCLF